MSRILVPIDFSHSSANALRYAYKLSLDLNMSISLFHCYHPQSYNRPYDFGKKDYALGVKEMLVGFYKKHAHEKIGRTHFIAQAGTVIKKVTSLSSRYKLVVLSGLKFTSNLHRWLGSRSSSIASLAKCPVMIVTPTTHYSPWNNIWHVNRKENEATIIEKKIAHLNIRQELIQAKTFEQKKFTSSFWQLMISIMTTHKPAAQQEILDALATEQVDLIILVSHQKDAFQKFVNNQDIQTLFEQNIPVLVFQE